ncbi:NKL protein, partial [Polypterus senegalus]|nr:antimicrobial peptide NK-lysin-like [Polypterus senegalus]MBN3290596.1 NKL protein [Polypterus senegalus]
MMMMIYIALFAMLLTPSVSLKVHSDRLANEISIDENEFYEELVLSVCSDVTKVNVTSPNFIMCRICTYVVGKVKALVPPGTAKDGVIRILHTVCDRLPVFRSVCRNIISNFLGRLVDEIIANDNPKVICQTMSFCAAKTFYR